MDLEALKKTWEKLPAEKQLNEEQLKKMLGNKTRNLVDRIDRNIKTGFIILFILIVVFLLDDLLLSPVMSGPEALEIPLWLKFLGVFSNTLIFTTFLYFAIKYYRVRKSFDMFLAIKETVTRIIETLVIYRTMFYLALFSLLLSISSSFITGLYTGFAANASQNGITMAQVEGRNLLVIILLGISVLLIITGSIFMFFRWGFRKLYGNYIEKLKLTLQEFEEAEE